MRYFRDLCLNFIRTARDGRQLDQCTRGPRSLTSARGTNVFCNLGWNRLCPRKKIQGNICLAGENTGRPQLRGQPTVNHLLQTLLGRMFWLLSIFIDRSAQPRGINFSQHWQDKFLLLAIIFDSHRLDLSKVNPRNFISAPGDKPRTVACKLSNIFVGSPFVSVSASAWFAARGNAVFSAALGPGFSSAD